MLKEITLKGLNEEQAGNIMTMLQLILLSGVPIGYSCRKNISSFTVEVDLKKLK